MAVRRRTAPQILQDETLDDEGYASHVEAIYGASRDDFIRERERRAKALRAVGHREAAAALAGCRKPTVPAWAVDQLARRHPCEVAELIAAADQARDIQRRAASGRGSAGLREAADQVRGLVAGLRERGRDLIEASGSRPDPHLEEVEQTLLAAATDPAHHETLRRGVFDRPLQPAGFGDASGLMLVAAPAVEGSERGDGGEHPEAAAEQERRRDAERERAARRRELEQRRIRLQRRRERQQHRAEQAEAKVVELRARADDASADAEEQRTGLARIDRELEAVGEEFQTLEE